MEIGWRWDEKQNDRVTLRLKAHGIQYEVQKYRSTEVQDDLLRKENYCGRVMITELCLTAWKSRRDVKNILPLCP